MENKKLLVKCKFFLVLFFSLLSLYCHNSEDKYAKNSILKDLDSNYYTNFKRTTYEKSKEIFITNEKEIESFTIEFQSQKNIEKISRDDYSLMEIDSSFKKLFPEVSNVLSYSIKLKNAKNVSIIIDENFNNQEENFWMQDFSLINTSENITLKDFLDQNQISQGYFRKYVNFLNKFKFFSVRKILNTNIIEIRIRISDGLIYNSMTEKNPESNLFIETKLINSNWSYFTEYKKFNEK